MVFERERTRLERGPAIVHSDELEREARSPETRGEPRWILLWRRVEKKTSRRIHHNGGSAFGFVNRADDAAFHGTAVFSSFPAIECFPVFMKTQNISTKNASYCQLGVE